MKLPRSFLYHFLVYPVIFFSIIFLISSRCVKNLCRSGGEFFYWTFELCRTFLNVQFLRQWQILSIITHYKYSFLIRILKNTLSFRLIHIQRYLKKIKGIRKPKLVFLIYSPKAIDKRIIDHNKTRNFANIYINLNRSLQNW